MDNVKDFFQFAYGENTMSLPNLKLMLKIRTKIKLKYFRMLLINFIACSELSYSVTGVLMQ